MIDIDALEEKRDLFGSDSDNSLNFFQRAYFTTKYGLVDFRHALKQLLQKIFRADHVSDYECYSLSYNMAKKILKRIPRFKKQTYAWPINMTEDEWKTTLDRIEVVLQYQNDNEEAFLKYHNLTPIWNKTEFKWSVMFKRKSDGASTSVDVEEALSMDLNEWEVLYKYKNYYNSEAHDAILKKLSQELELFTNHFWDLWY
jgi:hypothetical protein